MRANYTRTHTCSQSFVQSYIDTVFTQEKEPVLVHCMIVLATLRNHYTSEGLKLASH